MSAHCRLTGAQPVFGKKISHSHRCTSRRFDLDIQTKRYWLPSEGRSVRLRLSARAVTTVDGSASRPLSPGPEPVGECV